MGLTNGSQAQSLFLCCGFGFLLGVYYDIFRVIRIMMRPRAGSVFFQDLLFFVTSAIATFLFDLSTSGGQLRLYLFVGILLGFFSYYCTIGRLVMRFSEAVIRGILWFWHGLWFVILWPFRLVGRLISRPIHAIGYVWNRIYNRFRDFLKKHLKQSHLLLYNQNDGKITWRIKKRKEKPCNENANGKKEKHFS